MKKPVSREICIIYLAQNGDTDLVARGILTFDPLVSNHKIPVYLEYIFQEIRCLFPSDCWKYFSYIERSARIEKKLTKLDKMCHHSATLTILINCYVAMAEYYRITPEDYFVKRFYNKIQGNNKQHLENSIIAFGKIDKNGCIPRANREDLERKVKTAINIHEWNISMELGLNTQKRKYLVVGPAIEDSNATISNRISQEVLIDAESEEVEYHPIIHLDEAFVIVFKKSFKGIKSAIENQCSKKRKIVYASVFLLILLTCFFSFYLKDFYRFCAKCKIYYSLIENEKTLTFEYSIPMDDSSIPLVIEMLSSRRSDFRYFGVKALRKIEPKKEWFFSIDDFNKINRFLVKIRDADEKRDIVLYNLRKRFSYELKKMLKSYDGSKPISEEFKKLFTHELDIVCQIYRLYDPKYLERIDYKGHLYSHDANLLRFNRIFLEENYPDEIRNCQSKIVLAVEPLKICLQDKNEQIIDEAIETVKQIGPRAYPLVPILIEKAKDEKWTLKVIEALETIGPKAEQAVPFLIKNIIKKNYISIASIKALRVIKREKLEAVAKQLLDMASPNYSIEIRKLAIQVLGEINSEKFVPLLSHYLKDEYPIIRLKSVIAIGLIGNNKALRALIDISLQDKSEAIREIAIKMIGYGRGGALTRDMIISLSRREVIMIKGTLELFQNLRLPSSEIIPDILKLMENNDGRLDNNIYTFMNSFNKEAIPALISCLDDPNLKLYAVEALKQMDKEYILQAAPKLLAIANDSDAVFRYVLAYTLGGVALEDGQIMASLKKFVENKVDVNIREVGVIALFCATREIIKERKDFGDCRELKNLTQYQEIVKYLTPLLEDDNPTIQAYVALISIGLLPSEAEEFVYFIARKGLSSLHSEVRLRSALSLYSMIQKTMVKTCKKDIKHDEEILRNITPYLKQALNHQDKRVCIVAAQSLWLIEKKIDEILPVVSNSLTSLDSIVSSRSSRLLQLMGKHACTESVLQALIDALNTHDSLAVSTDDLVGSLKINIQLSRTISTISYIAREVGIGDYNKALVITQKLLDLLPNIPRNSSLKDDIYNCITYIGQKNSSVRQKLIISLTNKTMSTHVNNILEKIGTHALPDLRVAFYNPELSIARKSIYWLIKKNSTEYNTGISSSIPCYLK